MTGVLGDGRSAARALFGSTGAAVAELRGADATLRAALPLSRRVGVVAVAGGSGTTATVASLASLLARRRSGMVLAVDAAGGSLGLHRRTVAEDPGPLVTTERHERGTGPVGAHAAEEIGAEDSGAADALEAAALRRRSARTAADARAGLVRTASGLHLLEVAGPGRRAASVAEWGRAVSPVSRFFDLVVTDWGVRSPDDDFADVVATSHVVVVVTRAERHAASAAASALAASDPSAGDGSAGDGSAGDGSAGDGSAGDTGAGASGAGDRRAGDNRAVPRRLLVLVDVARTPDRAAPGLRRTLSCPVLLLPHEAEHARTPAPSSRRFSSRTRDANIGLAVAVMREALASQAPAVGRASGARPVPVLPRTTAAAR